MPRCRWGTWRPTGIVLHVADVHTQRRGVGDVRHLGLGLTAAQIVGLRDGARGQTTGVAALADRARLGRSTEVELAARLGLDEQEVHRVLLAAQPPVSLDLQVGETGERLLGNLRVDDQSDHQAHLRLLRAEVAQIMAETLSACEREVLVRRFGLGGGAPATLEEVGAAMGLTRLRVRHISIKALDKLRHPALRMRLPA